MRVARICIAAAAIATASSMLVAAPAQAHGSTPDPTTTVLTTAVAAPFNLDVRGGQVLVADGGLGKVARIGSDGTLTTLVADAPGTSGVARSRGSLAYTTTKGGQAGITASGVTILGPGGRTVEADTLAYETKYNPDGAVHYGVTNPSQCVTDALTAVGFPVDYTGHIDSHAYSLAAYRGGFVLADAGANALLRISRTGAISTLAVLPAQPSVITAAQATALGLPDCVAGTTYAFEAVPTDVEVGHDGYLYVTVLPGGPEGPVLGARGKVYRVNPWTGALTQVASGFAGATNLAIADGRIYVAELFGGRISVVRHGKVTPFLDLPGVVSVEAGPGGRLYAGTLGDEQSHAPGTVVRIDTARGWRH